MNFINLRPVAEGGEIALSWASERGRRSRRCENARPLVLLANIQQFAVSFLQPRLQTVVSIKLISTDRGEAHDDRFQFPAVNRASCSAVYDHLKRACPVINRQELIKFK